MSFLTPLYMAGLAAVTLPILFHMIRRTPKGKVPFSTLMFLEPSPPRVTKRSAIEHWLLLLLRAAAVILLAIAFSRPFLRLTEDIALTGNAKRTAILVDISASMRRDGLWTQAVEHVKDVLSEAGPHDEVAVIGFDRELRPLLTFAEWDGLDSGSRESIVGKRLATLKPGWLGTDLGHVLPDAVTTLLDHEDATETVRAAELVLISDLQRGSRSDSLQAYNWPDSVKVTIRPLEFQSTDNSSLQIVGTTVDADGLRVRVDNELDSTPERFDLLAEAIGSDHESHEPATVAQTIPTSAEDDTQLIAATHRREVPEWSIRDIHVPPGQNRVVKLTDLPDERNAFRLTLTGDKSGFDNEAWFVRPNPPVVTVQYFGDGDAGDAKSLCYYVERACLSTPAREVDFVADDSGFASAGGRRLIIVARQLDPALTTTLEAAIEAGDQIVVVGTSNDLCTQACHLVNYGDNVFNGWFTEASVDGYAMLSNLDLQHPLFQIFDDVRLSDFTKLHVWKHRTLGYASEDHKVGAVPTVLASFDDGDPAIVEVRRVAPDTANDQTGSVLLFTFGWHGEDSRFVLSSKFVPMMNHLIDRIAGTVRATPRLTVGSSLRLQDVVTGVTEDVGITMPSGTRSRVGVESTLRLNEPGVFQLAWTGPNGSRSTALAVNSDPLESRTAPLGLDELRALGVPLLDPSAGEETVEESRQLQARELESRQRIWQWVILAGVLILLLETWLAGRLAQGSHLAAQDEQTG